MPVCPGPQGCCDDCTHITIVIGGCTGPIGPNVPVTVSTSQGGMVLFDGVTDNSGKITFVSPDTSPGNPTVTYWISVQLSAASPRFADFQRSIRVDCRGPVGTGPNCADGYSCGPCQIPLKNALQVTTPVGNCTINHSGTCQQGDWSGTFVYNFPGEDCTSPPHPFWANHCPTGPVTITVDLLQNGVSGISWPIYGFFDSTQIFCPVPVLGMVQQGTCQPNQSTGSRTCFPPAFQQEFGGVVLTPPAGNTCAQCWVLPPGPWSVTITE